MLPKIDQPILRSDFVGVVGLMIVPSRNEQNYLAFGLLDKLSELVLA